jgi:hypothetical protein
MVAEALGSISRLMISHPSAPKTFPTDPVPENNSNNLIIYIYILFLYKQTQTTFFNEFSPFFGNSFGIKGILEELNALGRIHLRKNI